MPTAADANGIPRLIESDQGSNGTFSGLINLALGWVSDVIGGILGRTPYAEAAGTFSVPGYGAGGSSTLTINFPTGRFAVAPLLTFEPGEARVSVGILSRSATQVQIVMANLTSASSAAATGHWTARQMKSTVAAG